MLCTETARLPSYRVSQGKILEFVDDSLPKSGEVNNVPVSR